MAHFLINNPDYKLQVLEAARCQLGYTHTEFAKYLGIHYITWCRWRANGIPPRVIVVPIPFDENMRV